MFGIYIVYIFVLLTFALKENEQLRDQRYDQACTWF